jgi:hypothetical protein
MGSERNQPSQSVCHSNVGTRSEGEASPHRPRNKGSNRENQVRTGLSAGGKRIRTPGPTCGCGSLWANGTEITRVRERRRQIRQWTPMDSSGTKPSASAAAEERRRVGTNIGRICAAARAVGWDRGFESISRHQQTPRKSAIFCGASCWQ